MKLYVCAVLLLLAFAARSAEPPLFVLKAEQGLTVDFAGKPLIVEETLTLIPKDNAATDETPAEPAANLYENIRQESALLPDGRRVFNRFSNSLNINSRREVSISPDGQELELAFMAFTPAYNEAAYNKTIQYQLRLPLADFVGCKYTALTGRSSILKESNGIIKAGQSGRIGGAPVRQIAFEGPGRRLVIDCNPKGVNAHGDYPPTGIVGLWDVFCEGDSLLLTRTYSPKFFGGLLATHLVIYQGTAADFSTRHSTDAYRYYAELLPDRQYVLGAAKFGSQYTDAGILPYQEERKSGWLDNNGLTVSTYKPQGALYSAVAGTRPAIFRMNGLRSGVHILTVVTGTGAEPCGPFTLKCNGQIIAENLTVPAKHVQTIAFPVWLDNGQADLEFSGNWRVSTINDQLLQTTYEDYSFRRGFWLATNLPEPSPMHGSKSYASEPEFSVSISSYPLPEPGQETRKPIKTWDLPTSHARFAPGEDWRGQANIGSLGPGNNGTFMEFHSPELIQRRIRELKADNLDVIMTNGLLSRHTFPTHLKRVENNIAEFVKAGHAVGIKFVDHQDHSLLWDMDSGFRVMVENMPYLQQTLNGQLTARGLCPSNPEYFAKYRDYILQHIQVTGLDGIMIDEATFHGLNFCGCAHCRKIFTAETNWELPADECSPELLNKESELWRAWLRWRQKRLGDFWYQLKESIHRIKPDFVIMGYTTHYGMTSTYASLNLAAALEQSARGWDFVGTEIMTRNIYANYRAVMSLRQAKGQFMHSSGIPVFGLVYTDVFNWDLMYFGWAMNNMLGQATWEMTGHHCPADKSNYRLFTREKGNIALREAEQVSRIALLFSNQSRDWPRSTSYPPDVLGISQLLTLQHIPHVFINEAGLNQEVLGRYQVLMVSNAMALSDHNIAEIKTFARDGGRVYLSNRVANSNENGDIREEWPFADLLPLQKMERPSHAMKFYRGQNTAEEMLPDEAILGVRYTVLPGAESVGRVLWQYADKAGKLAPALYEVDCGKGKLYFSPLLLGAQACAGEVRTKAKASFQRKPASEEIALQILSEVTAVAEVWRPGNVPEAVLTNISRERNETVVHFLNATGSQLEAGQVVPSLPPAEPFPALNQDLRFELPLPEIQRAYAVSPDFSGEKELLFRKSAEGWFEITLPAELLKVYTLVRIR